MAGNVDAPAPNADGLQRLGRRMAALNDYTPQQSIELYPTSGTTDDDLYGRLGVAAARERGCRIQVGKDMLFEMIPAYLEFFGFGTATADELRAVAKVDA